MRPTKEDLRVLARYPHGRTMTAQDKRTLVRLSAMGLIVREDPDPIHRAWGYHSEVTITDKGRAALASCGLK